MKKTLSLLLVAAVAMTALVAAPKSKKTAEPAQPVSVKFSAENFGDDAQTLQDHVYNADGSVTYTAGFKYGGGGTSFLIDGKNGISGVTIWGISDRGTWLNNQAEYKGYQQYPLLWDNEFNCKPAFDGVLEAALEAKEQ
jgi:hypothetical protein